MKSRIWLELRELDYKETPNDRNIQDVGVELTRTVSPRFSSGLYGTFTRVEETDIDQTNKTYLAGADVVYQLANKLRAIVNLQYQTRDSNISSQEYDELSGFIGLLYGYGDVERTRGSSRLPR